MTTVNNPFTESSFVWKPTSEVGSRQDANLVKFVSAEPDPLVFEVAASFTLPDKSVTDLVVTVQGIGAGNEYFRRDLRGAWLRDNTTVTEMDAASSSGDATENDTSGDYDADLNISGTSVRVRTKGPGRWTISASRLVTARDPFDPLVLPEASATPIVWVNPDEGNITLGTPPTITGITNLAGGTATIGIPTSKNPELESSNADFANKRAFDVTSNKGFTIDNHGLTTDPFSVLFVCDGIDNAWFQDANGYYLVNAGGGSGDKLQATSNAGPYGKDNTVGVSGVAGVYIVVFTGTNAAKLYASKTTPATDDCGTLHDLTNVLLTVGGPAGLSGGGLGKLRHFMLFDGALSAADAEYLLLGFEEESGVAVG